MIRLPRFTQIPAARAGLAVLGPIGPEGSGVSYRAWSPGEGDAVTLWIDGARVEDDPVRAERLARQAFALERVRHPNLAEVLRFESLGGRLALIERPGGLVRAESQEPVDSEHEPGRRPGPSSVRRAVGEALQASRAIQALHDLGLSHGNLRPESLVELADGRVILTGLGRIPPPPEDPEATDPPAFPDPSAERSDLNALGCVLYERLTGTPPGPSSHPSETPPPESLNRRVPASVSTLIRRLRLPVEDGGFASIAPAVAELERIVGAPTPETFLPRQSLVEAYRSFASSYANAPTDRLGKTVTLGFYGGTGALVLLALLLALPSLALGLLHLMFLTALFGFVVGGVRRGGALFDRVRRFVLGGRGRDLATVAAAVVLGLLGLKAAGLLGIMIALGIVAAILAGVREVLIDDRLAQERREPLDRASTVLRDLRVHGLTEPAVRAFAIDHGGEHWGPLFLALFGADAYRAASTRRAVPWPDRWLRVELLGRMTRFFDSRLIMRRNERDRGVLTDLEEIRLKAAGVPELTARRRSWRIAPALIARARAFERGDHLSGGSLAASLADAIRNPETVLVEVEAENPFDRLCRRSLTLLDTLTGPRVRLLVGLALLAGFLAWMHQNRLIPQETPAELIEAARSPENLDLTELGQSLDARRQALQAEAERAEPLRAEIAPGLLALLFRHVGAGLAALILLSSCLSARRSVALASLGATVVALFGPDFGLPISVSLGLALGLALVVPTVIRRLA
ncbi:serine/threonine-protein kinase [Tautonia rosea]|uniref:hypothetical protein n=1 Tax=Tautonia rosea TaxID=2728037 RepID=UPI001473E1E0|nr:hypothetical protein [Tautonia rosea]